MSILPPMISVFYKYYVILLKKMDKIFNNVFILFLSLQLLDIMML